MAVTIFWRRGCLRKRMTIYHLLYKQISTVLTGFILSIKMS